MTEREKARRATRRAERRTEILQQQREYQLANAEKIKERKRAYYLENKEKVNAAIKEYRARNPNYPRSARKPRERTEADRERSRKNFARVYACPIARLKHNVRTRTSRAIRQDGYGKHGRTPEILGCTWPDLRLHIEKQFQNGMSWSNYGKWHVDHIRPLASATTEAQILALCHYTNLQPLWAEANLKKGARFQP